MKAILKFDVTNKSQLQIKQTEITSVHIVCLKIVDIAVGTNNVKLLLLIWLFINENVIHSLVFKVKEGCVY